MATPTGCVGKSCCLYPKFHQEFSRFAPSLLLPPCSGTIAPHLHKPLSGAGLSPRPESALHTIATGTLRQTESPPCSKPSRGSPLTQSQGQRPFLAKKNLHYSTSISSLAWAQALCPAPPRRLPGLWAASSDTFTAPSCIVQGCPLQGRLARGAFPDRLSTPPQLFLSPLQALLSEGRPLLLCSLSFFLSTRPAPPPQGLHLFRSLLNLMPKAVPGPG